MKGIVRVLVPLDPWRLALSLNPIEISRDHLVAVLPQASQEAKALFHDGDPYELQIEPEGDEMPISGIKAHLRRVIESPFGLELRFTFDESLEMLL